MSLRKMLALMMVLVIVGCQTKKPKKTSLRAGRGARGFFNSQYQNNPSSTAAKCGSRLPSYGVGEVTATQSQDAFWTELYYLTLPTLIGRPDEEQLGYVSGQSGHPTGVRFYGHAESQYGSGQGPVNPSNALIHLEIFDDKACAKDSKGNVIPIIVIRIDRNSPDFRDFQGYMDGYGRVTLNFVDKYGSIRLDGNISGDWFSGTMYYSTPQVGERQLGRFNVVKCGFFSCY